MLFTISTTNTQMSECVRLHTGAVYMQEKAVYMNNIHDKTIQWETRNKYCSIITNNIYLLYLYFWKLPVDMVTSYMASTVSNTVEPLSSNSSKIWRWKIPEDYCRWRTCNVQQYWHPQWQEAQRPMSSRAGRRGWRHPELWQRYYTYPFWWVVWIPCSWFGGEPDKRKRCYRWGRCTPGP